MKSDETQHCPRSSKQHEIIVGWAMPTLQVIPFLKSRVGNAHPTSYTISKKLGYSISPLALLTSLRFERGALVDRCVAPVDRNGISISPRRLGEI